MLKRILKFLYLKLKYRKFVIFDFSNNIGRNSSFEGFSKLGQNTTFSGKLGRCSYIGPDCYIGASVGRFTSIASGCRTIIGQHPYTYPYVSTSPVFFSLLKQCGTTFVNKQQFIESRYADETNKISVIIGNDCWINANVSIISGVTIGDGAVVLAGAVVTKDVPPYAIVGGVPAKVIKYRYSEEDIQFLLNVQWWNKDISWLKEYSCKFVDFASFKNCCNI